jgi:FlaA1/EpsC-like NDP-sugar epimerase
MIRRVFEKTILLNRIIKRLIMIFFDSIIIVSVLLISFSIRFDYLYWPKTEELFWIIFGAPLLAIPILFSFKFYQSVVRYIGVQALPSIVQALTLYSVMWGLLGYMANVDGIPRSVILINWMLIIITLCSSRILARWIFNNNSANNSKKNNVIIYGAGSAGRELSHALQLSIDFKLVAFIDDDEAKQGTYINNIPVYSNNKIESLINNKNINEILIALPSISRSKRNKIIENLKNHSVHIRILPSVSKLTEGKIKIEDLLEINIEDLLGRNSILPNKELLKINITNKVVMVTGAGGSIGSELCRQILTLNPHKIVLYEISESALYTIDQELSNMKNMGVEVISIIGSVRDFLDVKNAIKIFKVQTIYHTAAYKHVPLVESNQIQGLLNNSIGTMNAVEAAISEEVETFVLISTDKAVRPTNTMGASKRIAELILQGLSKQPHQTCLSIVRFGNVLESSGSVIPLFKKQIKKGGPITVTDKNIERYFMTIPEAVELVIQSGAMGHNGDVIVLDMGTPVKIYDLAKKMINLSGLKVLNKENPDGDIEIIFTGLRPGEKLYEELLIGNKVLKTQNKLIMRAQEEMINWAILNPILIKLNHALINGELNKTKEIIKELVPEFQPDD